MNTRAEIEVPTAPLRAQADGGAGGILGSPIFFLVAFVVALLPYVRGGG